MVILKICEEELELREVKVWWIRVVASNYKLKKLLLKKLPYVVPRHHDHFHMDLECGVNYNVDFIEFNRLVKW